MSEKSEYKQAMAYILPELATMRSRISELQTENDHLLKCIDDLDADWKGARLAADCLTICISELEAENDRLQDAWFHDETICPDGSLRLKVSTLLENIAELERSNELHRNLNRDVAIALGLNSGDSWHNLPERVVDLRKHNDNLEIFIDRLIETGNDIVAEYRKNTLNLDNLKKVEYWLALVEDWKRYKK